jgi:hypothetical protein
VARLGLSDVLLFDTPLHAVGPSGTAVPVQGVLGGDNLSRLAAGFDYRGMPTLTLTEQVTTCSCQLADDCQAVFPFSLQGGQLTIAGINGQNDLYSYPATRVLIDACLEPLVDPVSRDLPCAGPQLGATPVPPYQTTGIDVKVLIATGFPGFGLASSTYDRLRGAGAAQAALANPVYLQLPDPDDDGPDLAGLPVAPVTLGGGQRSAIAMVSRELYFGPCAQLARSRRQRRTPPIGPVLHPDEAGCLQVPGSSTDPSIVGCASQESSSDVCNDAVASNALAAVIEVEAALPTYVISDTAPIFQSVNTDVGPSANPAVEAIVGTELLQRLVSTIDYPNGRFIARCAVDQCLTYPRMVQNTECGHVCTDASYIGPIQAFSTDASGVDSRPGALCPPAP